MDYCSNHPAKKAYDVCRYCGKTFCKDCLTEGIEYCACMNPECQKANEAKLLAEEIECPKCGNNITLEFKERMSERVHCHECECMIDYSVTPPAVLEPKKYVEVTWSMNQGDIFFIKSLLDDAGIDYYTLGENFLNVDPLIQPARFFVVEDQKEAVKELLKDSTLNITGISFFDNIEG